MAHNYDAYYTLRYSFSHLLQNPEQKTFERINYM